MSEKNNTLDASSTHPAISKLEYAGGHTSRATPRPENVAKAPISVVPGMLVSMRSPWDIHE